MQTDLTIARALARVDGLYWDEVWGYETDADECDSSTCVATHWGDNDAEQTRRWYLHLARAAIAAMQADAAPVAWMYRNEVQQEYVSRVRHEFRTHGLVQWTETPLYAHPPVDDAAPRWMPIETAPKDGTRVLVYANRRGWEKHGYCCVTAEWHGSRWAVMGAINNPRYPDTKDECVPTHWMPLPAAPVDNRVSTSSPVDDRETGNTSDKLRSAVEVCQSCGGDGWDGTAYVGQFKCGQCNGTGVVKQSLTTEPLSNSKELRPAIYVFFDAADAGSSGVEPCDAPDCTDCAKAAAVIEADRAALVAAIVTDIRDHWERGELVCGDELAAMIEAKWGGK